MSSDGAIERNHIFLAAVWACGVFVRQSPERVTEAGKKEQEPKDQLDCEISRHFFWGFSNVAAVLAEQFFCHISLLLDGMVINRDQVKDIEFLYSLSE